MVNEDEIVRFIETRSVIAHYEQGGWGDKQEEHTPRQHRLSAIPHAQAHTLQLQLKLGKREPGAGGNLILQDRIMSEWILYLKNVESCK
jgi:hypothetical protein